MKARFIPYLLVVFAAAAWAMNSLALATEEPRKVSGVDRAKELLLEGRRKEAVEALDRVLARARGSREAAALREKRRIFLEQFLTSEAFQHFQGARFAAELERWADCLKECELIAPGDRDNLLVMHLRASCLMGSGQHDAAGKEFGAIRAMNPSDARAAIGLGEAALALKRYEQALLAAQGIPSAAAAAEAERAAILKARALTGLGKPSEAIEALRHDHERNLDHVRVIYELGQLYLKHPGGDWLARKYVSLFLSRCRRLKGPELKGKGIERDCAQAKEMLSGLERKLEY